MNTQSPKRRRRDDDDGSVIAIDSLSQLPQHILYHILSLLPQKDAVRTCVLSKSWRYLWHGRLNVEFRDDELCLDKKNKKFWSFVDKTLLRYLNQNLSLQKFLVDIEHEVDFLLLQKWIPVLIMNMGVTSLSLIFDWNHANTVVFPLPLAVFQSESLVELHLQWCNLNTLKPTDSVMLNNLQTLRLQVVIISDEIFEKIISGCPLIENLDLSGCTDLKSIKFHKHHNIKYIDCWVDDKTTIIEIENTHTLESVRIENCRNWFLCHKNMHFPHLKSLDLFKVQLPADIFDNFSSFFPCLYELRLNSCQGLKEFRLLSSSIKRLTIIMGTRNRIKAFIDTPNILYFEYSDDGFLPSIKFSTTSNEWKSQIFLWYKLSRSNKDAKAWFLKVNKLLKALSESYITLVFNPSKYKKMHINDSHGGFYKPVVVEHLKLWECFPSSDLAILNCLFRICRPRYIHMDLYDDDTDMDLYDDDTDMDDKLGAKCKKINNLAGFMSKTVPNETGCCFWLKDLEEVGIEVQDKEAKEWHCVEGTSLLALSFQQRVRFRLTWTEQISSEGADVLKISMSDEDLLNAKGDTYAVTLTQKGTYSFYCSPHAGAGMTGKVTVN